MIINSLAAFASFVVFYVPPCNLSLDSLVISVQTVTDITRTSGNLFSILDLHFTNFVSRGSVRLTNDTKSDHCTILFDLDGTLVDTAPDLMAAHNHVMKKYGHETKTTGQQIGLKLTSRVKNLSRLSSIVRSQLILMSLSMNLFLKGVFNF